MRSISRFESNLVRILHFLLGHAPAEQALPTIHRGMPRPMCLSRDAADLVQQSLATGTVRMLTRGGAWKQQRHLRGDEIREGSLWQRSKPEELGLEFSAASLDFLIWLTETDVGPEVPFWVPATNQTLTVGDEFLLYLAARALRETRLASQWVHSAIFRSNPLIALTLPQQFAAESVTPHPDFGRWMCGVGATVLEALQDDLANIWIALERDKSKISSMESMRQLGRVQESVLNPLFDAAEEHGRRDLCRFCLETMNRLLSARSHGDQWIAMIHTADMRLAERTELYQSAAAFLRTSLRLRSWQAASRGVGYFDEGYAESQLWKSLWESNSADESFGHADRIIRDLSF